MNDIEKPESGQGPSEEPVLSVGEAQEIIDEFKDHRHEYGENLDILENRGLMALLLGREIAVMQISTLTMPEYSTIEEHKAKHGDKEEFLAALASGRSLVDVVRMGDKKISLLMADVIGNELSAERRQREEVLANSHHSASNRDLVRSGIEKEFEYQVEMADPDEEKIIGELLPQAKEKALARAEELIAKYGIK